MIHHEPPRRGRGRGEAGRRDDHFLGQELDTVVVTRTVARYPSMTDSKYRFAEDSVTPVIIAMKTRCGPKN